MATPPADLIDSPAPHEAFEAADAGRRLEAFLAELPAGSTGVRIENVAGPPDAALEIPPDVLRLAARLLKYAAAHAPLDPEEWTTEQVANSLAVSVPCVIGLLRVGALPHRLTDGVVRVSRHDVTKFREENLAKRLQALDDLTAETEALGLYDGSPASKI